MSAVQRSWFVIDASTSAPGCPHDTPYFGLVPGGCVFIPFLQQTESRDLQWVIDDGTDEIEIQHSLL